MLAQRCRQQVPRHMHNHRTYVKPTVQPSLSKLWPAQYQHCHSRLKCRSVNPGQPNESDKAGSAADSLDGSNTSRSSSSGAAPDVSQQQYQPGPEQAAQQPVQQASSSAAASPSAAAAAAAAATTPSQSPQQQQQQQQQQAPSPSPQQQQHAKAQPTKPKTSSSKASTSRSSSSKTPPRKQQQRPFFLFAWFHAAVAAVRRMPSTLTTFLLGGLFSAYLLYSWALGSPLKRSHPYRFMMVFNEASKVDTGTPVRMKGVQIGNVVAATLYASHVDVTAEVADASNIVPQGSRVDINLLGIAADPWIDITPPVNAVVRKDHGPHHPACASEGLIVCHNGSIGGQLGGSTDFMMKFFLSQHDRTRVKTVDTLYHGRTV